MILAICANPAIDSLARIGSLTPGKMHRMLSEERFPGGKGVHVAMAAAEMGTPSSLLGFWGGPTGKWVKERSQELGISCTGVDVPGWTRICYTFQSDGEYDDTELLGCGPEISNAEASEFLRIFETSAPNARTAVISGSFPRGLPTDFYGQMIKIARAKSCPVILDCSGEALLAALPECPWGVHLNRDEAEQFSGSSDLFRALDKIPPAIHTVAITAGKDGLFLRFGGATYRANVTIEKNGSAVGSGDCLTAGLAIALCRGLDAENTARLAVACGAANCLRSELGMLYRHDVEALMPRVEVKRWEPS